MSVVKFHPVIYCSNSLRGTCRRRKEFTYVYDPNRFWVTCNKRFKTMINFERKFIEMKEHVIPKESASLLHGFFKAMLGWSVPRPVYRVAD